MTAAPRTIYCPDCHQPLTGNWIVVLCYCAEYVPTDRESIGHLIADGEVVRLTGYGVLVAVAA